jgi:hypothetical protein
VSCARVLCVPAPLCVVAGVAVSCVRVSCVSAMPCVVAGVAVSCVRVPCLSAPLCVRSTQSRGTVHANGSRGHASPYYPLSCDARAPTSQCGGTLASVAEVEAIPAVVAEIKLAERVRVV